MKILIVGGCGFVGANLAGYFNKKDYEVIAFDNLVRRGSEMNLKWFKKAGIQFIHGDVRNKEDFKLIPKVDVILETSAQPSAIDGYNNPTFDITNNTIGCMNAIEKAREDNAIFIFWSTNKVYSGDKINSVSLKEKNTRYIFDEEPQYKNGFYSEFGFDSTFSIDGGQHSIYGLSKVMADLMVQEWYNAFGVRTVVNRFSCLAGKGQFGKCAQGWVAWWVIANYFDLPIQYIGWKGKQVRDILFIDDICKLIESEIINIDKIKGKVYNIGGGDKFTLSLREATEMVQELMGKKFKEINHIEKCRKADHCVYISDIRDIEYDIGWKPKIKIEDGYKKIIEWVKENEEELKYLYL